MAATAEQIVKDVQAAVDSIKRTQAELDSRLKELAEKKADKEVVGVSEKLAKDIQAHADRIVDLEQKLAEGVSRGKEAPKTLGQLVVTTDAFKNYAKGMTSRMRVEANTIIGQEGSPPENSDVLVARQRLPGIVPGAFRALRVRDILLAGTTNSNMVEFTRENAFTNNAAETAEGAGKPESSLTFEHATAPVRTIAHWIKVSTQVLDDAPALASYIDTRLRYGVELRVDNQLLNGDGSGQNISGLTDTGNFTAYTGAATDDTPIDTLNKAKYQVIAADYAPTAVILNPADWGEIERTKGSDGQYIFGAPANAVIPLLWGLPVVVTNTMTQGKFLIAAFDIAAQVWNRMGTVVEMFAQDDDNVQKNLVTIRAETRLALAVYRPASVVYGDLTL